MKQELIDRWCAPLESGKYEQGYGQLRSTDDGGVHRYCCLGVLADILVPTWDGQHLDTDDRLYGIVPTEVEEALIEHNDGRGWLFPNIASWIRENVKATE